MTRTSAALRMLTGTVLAVAVFWSLRPAAAQSTDPESYVVLARDSIRLTGLRMEPGRGGHLGVLGERGSLVARHRFATGGYDVVSPLVRFDGEASCGVLFADQVRGATATCGSPRPYVRPFDDVRSTCDFPDPFPACDPLALPVVVRHDETRTLEPGTYGDLKVEGGGAGPGTLVLTGGEYRFCNIQVGRRGRIRTASPTTVFAQGAVTTSNSALVGPGEGSDLGPKDFRLIVAGTRIRISRRGKLRAHVCAPNARLSATSASLTGRFVVASLRARSLAAELSPSVTTTTTVATTTSTTAGSTTTTSTTDPCAIACGKPECSPVCAPEDDSPCGAFTSSETGPVDAGSCAGALLGIECSRDCSEDCKTVTYTRCELPTTTVPTTSTTTTQAAITTTTGTTPTTTVPPARLEICGNCLDDDEDGDVDLADSDCCAGQGRFAAQVRRAKIRARKAGSGLRLRAVLARSGLAVDPAKDEVSLLLTGPDREPYLCAVVPAGKMRKTGRVVRINNKRAKLATLQGVDRLRFKQQKKGALLLRASGKRVQYTATPRPGDLRVTVGFRRPGAASANRCAAATIRVQATKNRKALRYP